MGNKNIIETQLTSKDLLELISEIMVDKEMESITNFSEKKLNNHFQKMFKLLNRLPNILKKSNSYDLRIEKCRNSTEKFNVERSKEMSNIRKEIDLFVNDFAKSFILFYNELQTFYKLIYIKHPSTLIGILFKYWQKQKVIDQNITLSEYSGIIALKEIEPQLVKVFEIFEEFSFLSLFKMVKKINGEYLNLGLSEFRNYLILTKLRNLIAHDDIGTFLGQIENDFIKVFEKIVHDIFKDVEMLQKKWDTIFPFHEKFSRRIIVDKKFRRNKYGRTSVINIGAGGGKLNV